MDPILIHLTITRRTLESLLSNDKIVDDAEPDPPHEAEDAGDPPGESATASAAGDPVADPASPSSGPLEWTVARERILVLLAGPGGR